MTFAVAVLLGLASIPGSGGVKISTSHKEQSATSDAPPDDILLQVGRQHRHRKNPVVNLKKSTNKKAAAGEKGEEPAEEKVDPHFKSPHHPNGDQHWERGWWELDQPHERIHGTHPHDDVSPYDPDVVDAPEDIKRVNNTHEELHNAKLSPDGYFTGFFHKDHEGKYAQVSSTKLRRHRHHHRQHQNVQLADHGKDTDDIVPRDDYVETKDHSNDTDDLVPREDYVHLQDHINDTDDIAQGQDPIERSEEEEHDDFQFVQLSDDPQSLAEVPQDQDPLEFAKKEAGEVPAIEYVQLEDDFQSLAEIPDGTDPLDFAKKEAGEVPAIELLETEADFIPHENDTEDVIPDASDDIQYNAKHSKLWNDTVNKKAKELDDLMQAQETAVLAQRQAKKDAELKKADESRKRAMEAKKREQMARENALHDSKRTVDFSELYSTMVPVAENVQTAAELNDYEHHSQYWNDRVNEATTNYAQSFAEESDRIDAESNPHNVHYYRDQNDFEQEYDGMLLQKDYEHHSPYWESRVEQASQDYDKKFEEESAQIDAESNPHNVHYYRDQNEFEQEYDGMLLQKEYRHHSPYWESRVEEEQRDFDKKFEEDSERLEAAENPHNVHHYRDQLKYEDEYDGMLIQHAYEKHHDWWNGRVEEQTKVLSAKLEEAEEMDKRRASPDYPEFYGSRIDKEELYNGMLLQYEPEVEIHSPFYRQHELEEEAAWEQEQIQAEYNKEHGVSVAEKVQKGETPKEEQLKTYNNPSVDLNEMYEGMNVQLSDHEDDTDDVVPEMNIEVQQKVESAMKLDENIKQDFGGSQYTENYDDEGREDN